MQVIEIEVNVNQANQEINENVNTIFQTMGNEDDSFFIKFSIQNDDWVTAIGDRFTRQGMKEEFPNNADVIK